MNQVRRTVKMRPFSSFVAIVLALALGLALSPAYGHHVTLSLEWGPGICTTSYRPCRRPAYGFHIRGMWPASRNGGQPESCDPGNEFKFHKLSRDLRTDLGLYWFSYFSYETESLWAGDWQRHGTCLKDVNKLRGMERYFGTTIKIAKSFPLLGTLRSSNITPGPGRGSPYASWAIINSLRSLTNNKAVQIDCDSDYNTDTGPYLTGINFCFDKRMNYVDCPDQKPECRERVYFKSW